MARLIRGKRGDSAWRAKIPTRWIPFLSVAYYGRAADPALIRAGPPSPTLMSPKNSPDDRTVMLRHLRQLIAAIDRRVPHIERAGEIAITQDAAALREKALARIAELERAD